MTGKKVKSGTIDVKALLAGDEEFLRGLVRTALQEVLEAEMTEALGAEKSERTAGRRVRWTHRDLGSAAERRGAPWCIVIYRTEVRRFSEREIRTAQARAMSKVPQNI